MISGIYTINGHFLIQSILIRFTYTRILPYTLKKKANSESFVQTEERQQELQFTNYQAKQKDLKTSKITTLQK